MSRFFVIVFTALFLNGCYVTNSVLNLGEYKYSISADKVLVTSDNQLIVPGDLQRLYRFTVADMFNMSFKIRASNLVKKRILFGLPDGIKSSLKRVPSYSNTPTYALSRELFIEENKWFIMSQSLKGPDVELDSLPPHILRGYKEYHKDLDKIYFQVPYTMDNQKIILNTPYTLYLTQRKWWSYPTLVGLVPFTFVADVVLDVPLWLIGVMIYGLHG